MTNLDWMDKYREQSNYIPGQQEIKFFWPLTEQIPLDLDYTGCDKPTLTVPISAVAGSQTIAFSNGTWTATPYINMDDIKFTLNKKPGIIRRLAYKLLGINWETR
jgi:hypothetical protein